jgi:hypothetical protein
MTAAPKLNPLCKTVISIQLLIHQLSLPAPSGYRSLKSGCGAPAHVGYIQESLSLLSVERANQLDPSVDMIDQSILGFAVPTIGGVNPLVTKANHYMLKRPILSIRIHPQRNRGTRTQRHRQKFLRSWPDILAASRSRLIRVQQMATVQWHLLETIARIANHRLARTNP